MPPQGKRDSANTPLVQPIGSLRPLQKSFKHYFPQSQDAHTQRTPYPPLTDPKKLLTSHAVRDRIKTEPPHHQLYEEPLRLRAKSRSVPASVLDEVSEIKFDSAGCHSPSIHSEASVFLQTQATLEPTYSLNVLGENAKMNNLPSNLRHSQGGELAREHTMTANHPFATPFTEGRKSFTSHDPKRQRPFPAQAVPKTYQEWVQGLVAIATHVWMPLGLFAFQPVDSHRESAAVKGIPNESTNAVHITQNDKIFLHWLQHFYLNSVQEGQYSDDEFFFLSNGLWHLLLNTVLYCLSLLELHRDSLKGAEKKQDSHPDTGGTSSSSLCGSQAPGWFASSVPVALSWAKTTTGKCAAPSNPQQSRAHLRPHQSVSSRSSEYLAKDESPADMSQIQPLTPMHCSRFSCDLLETSKLCSLEELYDGQLRNPLSILDWYLLVQLVAQFGYARDRFYVQTPTHASPHELLLVMLWLTKQYQLISFAQYVEMNQRYPFLLHYYATGSDDGQGEAGQETAISFNQDKLLFSFSKATVWPPESFDESAAIDYRLHQIERIIGQEPFERPGFDSVTEQTGHSVKGRGRTILRRVLAAQNLIRLSFNRLEHALEQRNELVSTLGLHSCVDAQLCLYENHNLYVRVMEGLRFVIDMEERLLQHSRSLRAAGLLISFVIKHRELRRQISEQDVIESLEKDATTWLATQRHSAQAQYSDGERHGIKPQSLALRLSDAVRGGRMPDTALCQTDVPTQNGQSTKYLSHILSQFRAARVRENLGNSWRSILRRAQIGVSPDLSVSHTLSRDDSIFFLSHDCQEKVKLEVQHDMDFYYSLHSALAAELLTHQYEHNHRQNILDEPEMFPEHENSSYVMPSSPNNPCPPLESAVCEEKKLASPLTRSEGPLAVPLLLRTVPLPTPVVIAEGSSTMPKCASPGERDIQLVEVGDPGPGATTSASIELERLSRFLEEINKECEKIQDARIVHCEESLKKLYRDYKVGILTNIAHE